MYYYFTSDYPAVLKLNGLYLGSIKDTVKSLSANQPPFIEVCPLQSGYEQINFIPNAEFLSTPTNYVAVTDLNGGYLFHFSQTQIVSEFKMIAQEKCENALVTIYNDNGVKLSIESPSDFFVGNLTRAFSSVEIKFFSLGESKFVSIFTLGKENLLTVYHIGQKTEIAFCREVSEYSIDDTLKTKTQYKDIQKHEISSEWNFNGYEFTEKSHIVLPSEQSLKTDFNRHVLPYAFIEEILVGGYYERFTGGIVKENARKIKGYFGDFIGVMPPPAFRTSDQVGIIYKDGINRYSVKYFTFSIDDGKVIGIHPVE